MSAAVSSCACSARRARRTAALALSPQHRHSSTAATPYTAEQVRARLESQHREAGTKNPLAGWTPSQARPMLPLQPRPINWSHALAAPLYNTPAPATTPRVPINILAPFDHSNPSSLAPTAAEAASTPSPLLVAPKHTLRHAVRSIELHLGSPPAYFKNPKRAAQATPNSVGYQAHTTKLTHYPGFTREDEIRKEAVAVGGEKKADRRKTEQAVRAHYKREVVDGDYSDHVARGPLLARLLRATSSSSASEEVHEAVQVADQALALNPSLGQVAKQFVLHAIQERVDPPAPPVAAAPATSAPKASEQGSAKKGNKRRAK
ncbi:unnamed protein product [Tilletia controversa]|uniref:Uncharacterized protein n=3 Tax=Tilletia TaxID=13289 RepID=A0A8X7MUF2_9BASI|nr:hypothetical protein CF336_g3398 [Tilletia laevis]KAE8201917.1 hypothetical protein CF328_g2514 [Tilletia controversa]KAE8261299.1 hypothetical protein A4X03_0g3377 [Tilletia caries]KAE8204870.1 hypothetical protein CF335_g2502 [Tilletia laevis]KAE8248860.1 hypothetical protein A4X06_0g3493 [Tilletia controversa]